MCGIEGFNWDDEELVADLMQCMEHRGPDQHDHYVGEHLSLGHRRLSILDLSEDGKQPMWDADEKVAITFNGEIFNYEELKADLQHYSFQSATDTEVLLCGYIALGEVVLDKVNGQYAFAIYDGRLEELFLARDRLVLPP